MLVLGIDSATLVAGIAVMDEERLIVEGFLQTEQTHSERLLPLIQFWLQEAKLSLADMEGIAVTSGPGSFTGLRIGMATAKGLAQATHKPLVGVSTLDALALNVAGFPGIICPILDARKKEVYTALYYAPGTNQLAPLTPGMALGVDKLVDFFRSGVGLPCLESKVDLDAREISQMPIQFLGDGVPVYWEQLKAALGSRACRALPSHNWLRAAQVAFLGQAQLKQGVNTDYHLLRPHYIRPSEAEVKWQEKYGQGFKSR